jgi:hypothetical protein
MMGRPGSLPYLPNGDGSEITGGYAVRFSYSVDGRVHKGLTKSSFEVREKDPFPIRYNPRHPEENNTLDSANSRATLLVKFLTPALVFLMLFMFMMSVVFRH